MTRKFPLFLLAVAALAAPFAAGELARAPWVPSWDGPMQTFSTLLAFAGVVFAVVYAWSDLRGRRPELSGRLVFVVLRALVLIALAGAMAVLGQLRVFPPRFAQAVATPSATAYVYDVSQKGPEVEVRVRRDPWPITDRLVYARDCRPKEVVLDADGHTLHVCGQRCDLRRRQCVGAD
jgi:hypothetical protein